MLIHAADDKAKRAISIHIVTGQICKNCLNYHKSCVFPNTGYCDHFNKAGLGYNDFCSLFRRVQK